MISGYNFDRLHLYEIKIDSLFYFLFEELFGIDTNWDKIEEKQKELRDHYAEYYATTQQVHHPCNIQ